MSKLIKNPTKNNLKVLFGGNWYELAPDGERIVSDELAVFWKKIHAFLEIHKAPEKELVDKKVLEELREELIMEEKKESEELIVPVVQKRKILGKKLK